MEKWLKIIVIPIGTLFGVIISTIVFITLSNDVIW
jgi:hypothetical protein